MCDYYSYIAQFCTLGNLAFQLGPEVFEIEKDCLPLTKIMYNKNKVADIKTKLAGTGRGTCPGAAANIELASGASVEVEPTATDGDCIFYVYNNNGGTVKLTLTETVRFLDTSIQVGIKKIFTFRTFFLDLFKLNWSFMLEETKTMESKCVNSALQKKLVNGWMLWQLLSISRKQLVPMMMLGQPLNIFLENQLLLVQK